MTKTVLHGIRNCDTMKKAFAWLDRHKVPYAFHDYKKIGADPAVLKRAVKELGWENTLNRKGTTWRALPDRVRETMNADKAVETALENPSVIRRPLIVHGETLYAGFDEADYKKIFITR